jgi:regulator of protease activity HflC (stomatin/prohibitin superfamily)
VTIGSDEVGVNNRTSSILTSGSHVISGDDQLTIYKLKTDTLAGKIEVINKDGDKILVEFRILFHPDKERIGLLHESNGPDYIDKVIIPTSEKTIRQICSDLTIEPLQITSRGSLATEIKKVLHPKLNNDYIILTKIEILNITAI